MEQFPGYRGINTVVVVFSDGISSEDTATKLESRLSKVYEAGISHIVGVPLLSPLGIDNDYLLETLSNLSRSFTHSSLPRTSEFRFTM